MTEPVLSASAVSWTTEGPVFVVRMDNPPANQLGQPLVNGLAGAGGASRTRRPGSW
jgi:hypothetical protein